MQCNTTSILREQRGDVNNTISRSFSFAKENDGSNQGFLVTVGNIHLDTNRNFFSWDIRAILDGFNCKHLGFDAPQFDNPVHATNAAKYTIGL